MNNEQKNLTAIQTLKGFLIGLNALTFIGGVCLIVLGISAMFIDNVMDFSVAIPSWTIVIGIFIIIVSLHGGFGSYMEHKKLLLIYFVVVSILIVAQIILLISGFAFQSSLKSALDSSWQKAYDNDLNLIKQVQNSFECCGFNDSKDRAYPTESKNSCLQEYGYHKSCRYSLMKSYRNSETLLIIGGVVVGIIQIAAMLFAFVLVKLLQKTETNMGRRGESEALLSSEQTP